MIAAELFPVMYRLRNRTKLAFFMDLKVRQRGKRTLASDISVISHMNICGTLLPRSWVGKMSTGAGNCFRWSWSFLYYIAYINGDVPLTILSYVPVTVHFATVKWFHFSCSGLKGEGDAALLPNASQLHIHDIKNYKKDPIQRRYITKSLFPHNVMPAMMISEISQQFVL